MIVAAAICPSPPLLASELAGQADVLPELRAACAVAAARILKAAPDLVAVVGPAETTGPRDPSGELNLASFAPALHPDRPLRDNSKKGGAGRLGAGPPLPLALGVGGLLLDEAGYTGPRTFQGIAENEPAVNCLALGRQIAASAPRVALLAVGDGSARRSTSAPGYLDERAAPFDQAVEHAVRDGDLPAIAALSPALAAELLAGGRPAWQAMSGAMSAASQPADHSAAVDRPQTEILYSDAPLGVAYLVATLIPGSGKRAASD
jgi:hypothetical protein